MKKLKFNTKILIFLILPLVSLFSPTHSFASYTTLFSDNFSSPIEQKLDIYNPNYFNFQTTDSDGGTVYNGKEFENSPGSTEGQDFYDYTGLGPITNPCSVVTGVVNNGAIIVDLLGEANNIGAGNARYYISNSPDYPQNQDVYLYLSPYYPVSYFYNLGPANINFSTSHVFSACYENGQLTFSIGNNVIDQRSTSFIPYYPAFAIDANSSNPIPPYMTNYTIKQYTINPPVTTATLSPTPYSDGTYFDPTTVTLSATATSGYTVANTYYSIDGGSQQIYSSPFIVTGTGSHTITYWSVDNNGDTEATNTKTFTIVDPPYVGAINFNNNPDQINNSTTAIASFTDSANNSDDTATWNWGDGTISNPDITNGTVTENSGSGSVTDNHTYTSLGSYTVTLTVTNPNTQSSTSQTTIAVVPAGGITGANISHANYNGANFSNLDLTKTNGTNGQFQNVNFTSANLTQANFSGSNLSGSNFTNANLTKTNLSNTNLSNVNFTGANLTQANLSGATITGVIWSNTTCPNGTNSNNDGGTCVGQGGGL